MMLLSPTISVKPWIRLPTMVVFCTYSRQWGYIQCLTVACHPHLASHLKCQGNDSIQPMSLVQRPLITISVGSMLLFSISSHRHQTISLWFLSSFMTQSFCEMTRRTFHSFSCASHACCWLVPFTTVLHHYCLYPYNFTVRQSRSCTMSNLSQQDMR